MMHENDRHHIIASVGVTPTSPRLCRRYGFDDWVACSWALAPESISIKLTVFNSWESEIKSLQPENFFPLRHSTNNNNNLRFFGLNFSFNSNTSYCAIEDVVAVVFEYSLCWRNLNDNSDYKVGRLSQICSVYLNPMINRSDLIDFIANPIDFL